MTPYYSSTCQVVDAVAWHHSTVAALLVAYTILMHLSYAGRLKDRWANSSPQVAATLWYFAVLPTLLGAAALALFTVLIPAGTRDNTGQLYVCPPVSLFLCAAWVAVVGIRSAPAGPPKRNQRRRTCGGTVVVVVVVVVNGRER
jgi:hypothetical protein